jgi:redox-sensitive bicupin YhaK (pirin superfamily)
MKRKEFIRNTLLTGAFGIAVPSFLKGEAHPSTYDTLKQQIGFNHLPNKEEKTMNTVLHKAETRGHANHGWLNSHHSFSFANYHNPDRMHFGVLRVLNDDQVEAGKGFGTHPHDNMEIISIPLEGDLEHKDSMGNTAVIREGDVQVLSAGTGIYHSEYNKNSNNPVKFLQIWLFPRSKGVEPRYDQISTADIARKNSFYQILSPQKDDEGVWIHQDAWFHLGKFDTTTTEHYTIKKEGNGVYAFILEGEAEIAGQKLQKRDGFGIWDVDSFEVKAEKDSKILLMDVPMAL